MTGADRTTSPQTGRQTPNDKKIGFTRAATVQKIFTDAEMDGLIAWAKQQGMGAGTISGGESNNTIRRSEVAWLRRREGFTWIYERIWPEILKLNKQTFQFDITGFAGSIQLARYDSSQQGFYNWHMDNGDKNTDRKISFSVQVSDQRAYEGGELELWFKVNPLVASRERGSITAFPSFVMHRVKPVTKGERFSLVAWIRGPRWR